MNISNKSFAPIIILIAVLFVVGIGGYVYFQSQDSSIVSKTTTISDNVVDANNQFGLDLYDRYSATKGKDENIFFSPFSISSVMAMAYEGAKWKTAKEIQSVFHFPEDVQVLREGYQSIYDNINNKENKEEWYKLNVANALWVQSDYKLLDDYLAIVQQYYNGKAANVDFINSTEETRQTINEWVANKTNDKIQDLIPSGSLNDSNDLTRLVLTNAIYFKGIWENKFSESLTEEKDFNITLLLKTKAQMMNQVDHYGHAKLNSIQLLELPYMSYSDERLSMLIILPNKNDIISVENKLNMQTLYEWVSKLEMHKVNVSLPKFKIETTENLNNDLKAIGMTTAFSSLLADFSRMTDTEKLYIDKVLHKAFIENEEGGTEATAVTAIIMDNPVGISRREPPEKIYKFIADHPFIFLILQKTEENKDNNELGNILFMGRVSDPF